MFNLFFRKIGQDVKKHGITPLVAQSNLKRTIKRKYEVNFPEALATLPKRQSLLKTLSRKKKLSHVPNFDPLAPPENLYVSFCRMIFNVIFRNRLSLSIQSRVF